MAAKDTQSVYTLGVVVLERGHMVAWDIASQEEMET